LKAWFFEGLACYIAEQQKEPMVFTLKDLITHFKSNDKQIYSLGYSAISQLLREK
jgi:hypothetical protein